MASRLAAGLQERFTEATGSGQAARKTDAFQGHRVTAGRFKHQSSHEVVSEEMHANLAVQVFRSLATQVVHLESDLEIAQGQFHGPTAVVKLAQRVRRILN